MKANNLIRSQQKEISELNRKLQFQTPYNIKMLESKILALKQAYLVQKQLYEDVVKGKRPVKRVTVNVGGRDTAAARSKSAQNLKDVKEEVALAPGYDDRC